MFKSMTALVLAATIGLTPMTSRPAQADTEDVVGVIAGIAALAIIGKAISDRNKDDDKKPATTRNTRNNTGLQARPNHSRIDHGFYHRHNGYAHTHGGRLNHTHGHRHFDRGPRLHARYVLPEQCLRTFNTFDGPRRAFGGRCLDRNFRFANRLPNHCERRIRTDRGNRFVFSPRCLRRNGYVIG